MSGILTYMVLIPCLHACFPRAQARWLLPLWKIFQNGNYPKYVVTRSDMIQRRGGIRHVNAPEFMLEGGLF